MITTQISPLNGLARTCSIGQIAYMDFEIKEAKIRFDVTITDLNITKSFWSHISNANKVTEAGVMITRSFTDSTFVEPEQLEEGQDIEQLKDQHYQAVLESGIPEFDFWMQLINSENLILQGITMMEPIIVTGKQIGRAHV